MPPLQAAILQRKALLEKLDGFIDALEGNTEKGIQARALTDDEQKQIPALRSQLEELERSIKNLEFLEEQKRNRAKEGAPKVVDPGTPPEDPLERLAKEFDLTRAAKMVAKSQKLDGAEAEYNAEAIRQAQRDGIPYQGGLMIPMGQQRTIQRDANGVASASGNLIATTLQSPEQGYQIDPFVRALGARVVTGLVGIRQIPVIDLLAEASYVGETDALPQIDPTVRKATLTPKPVVAKIPMTNLLVAEAGQNAIGMLATDTLRMAEVYAVERGIISGSGDAPTGILNDANVPNLDLDSSRNILFLDLLKIKNNPGKNNARFVNGPRGWVTNEDVRTWLESTQHGTSGRFIWPVEAPDKLLGYNAITTSLVPNDGGTNDDESSLIFGIWSNLVVANWAYRELVLDKVSDDGTTWFKWYSYWSHALLSPKAFAKCRNIITVETT